MTTTQKTLKAPSDEEAYKAWLRESTISMLFHFASQLGGAESFAHSFSDSQLPNSKHLRIVKKDDPKAIAFKKFSDFMLEAFHTSTGQDISTLPAGLYAKTMREALERMDVPLWVDLDKQTAINPEPPGASKKPKKKKKAGGADLQR